MSSPRFTPKATRDLEDICDFIANRSPAASARLLAAIQAKCQLLAQFPEMGRDRADLSPSLRSAVVGDYLIFYRPVDDGIEVMRIIHGSRFLPDQFR